MTKADVFLTSFVTELESGLRKELGLNAKAVVELESNDGVF